MANQTSRLILEYQTRLKHPLANGIIADDLPALADALRNRLAQSASELDLSPHSLPHLSRALRHYAEQHARVEDEETLQIVREIAAYLGSVFLQGLHASWDNAGTLLSVGVAVEGQFEAIKGKERRRSSRRLINIGYLAAGAWDGALQGVETDLAQAYKRLTARRLREHLGKNP